MSLYCFWLSEMRCTTRPSMEQPSFSCRITLALPSGSRPPKESKSSWRHIKSRAVLYRHPVRLPAVPETKTQNRSRNVPLGVKTTAVLWTRLLRTPQTFSPPLRDRPCCMYVHEKESMIVREILRCRLRSTLDVDTFTRVGERLVVYFLPPLLFNVLGCWVLYLVTFFLLLLVSVIYVSFFSFLLHFFLWKEEL